jgi:hypothetical protein
LSGARVNVDDLSKRNAIMLKKLEIPNYAPLVVTIIIIIFSNEDLEGIDA